MQVPALHRSLPVHTSWSSQVWSDGRLSATQASVASSHRARWQVVFAAPLQSRAGPAIHTPPVQESLTVQCCPSEHGAPLGRSLCVQPVVGLQPSVVHSLLSLQSSGVPCRHEPETQVSAPLHGLRSSHCEFALHEQPATGAPLHWLPLHVSELVHWLPSVHDAPSFEG
jgi:hypothetical protein